jgi:hypothetical protein
VNKEITYFQEEAMRRGIASGIIFGKADNLVRPIEQCIVTETGAVVVKLRGVKDEIHAFNLEGTTLQPDDVTGLSITQARAVRDKQLAS